MWEKAGLQAGPETLRLAGASKVSLGMNDPVFAYITVQSGIPVFCVNTVEMCPVYNLIQQDTKKHTKSITVVLLLLKQVSVVTLQRKI